MSDSKIADVCAAGSVGVACVATWAAQTLPIIEWLSYAIAAIAGLISIYKHIVNSINKRRKTDG